MLVLVAGMPRQMLGPLIKKLKRSNENLDVLETLPLDSTAYSAKYADKLYGMLGSGLRKAIPADCRNWWDFNFVVLYLRRGDGSDHHVVERFDMEALLVPVAIEATSRRAPRGHKNRSLVNGLVSQSIQLLRNARVVLRSLAQEMTNRDTRTCVLLPRANFGVEFEKVKECVQGAVANRDSAGTFDAQLRAVAARLPKGEAGRFRSGRLVFRAPAKAGARHGLAPLWDTKGHNDRCVIRGRIRFGVPYDPEFHYDCELAPNSGRRFPSCHGERELKRGRSHVNIAPNDNIR